MSEPDHPLKRNVDVLHAELKESIAQARRGEAVPVEQVLAELDAAEARILARKARLSAAE